MRFAPFKWTFALVLCALALASVPALTAGEKVASEISDAGRGKALAARLCVNCHIVSEDGMSPVQLGVPSFSEIANRRDQSARHIRGILIKPHAPMPNMALTRSEMEDIIAYLDELRDAASGPPLLAPRKPSGPQPVYPDAG